MSVCCSVASTANASLNSPLLFAGLNILSLFSGEQVDAVRNLIYVRGQVPGHKGNFVKVRDAVLKTFKQQPERPMPTFLGSPPLEPMLAPKSAKSPFDYTE